MRRKVESWGWTKYRNKSVMFHEMLIFKAEIDFSSPANSCHIVLRVGNVLISRGILPPYKTYNGDNFEVVNFCTWNPCLQEPIPQWNWFPGIDPGALKSLKIEAQFKHNSPHVHIVSTFSLCPLVSFPAGFVLYPSLLFFGAPPPFHTVISPGSP